MENRQAVTNRLKVLIDLLDKSLSGFSQESEIRLVSIASGSAQAVVEALKKTHNRNVKAILVDADSTAIDGSPENHWVLWTGRSVFPDL